MTTHRVSSKDAILVYLLTDAYYHDITVSSSEEARAWRAKEMWAGVFYIWPRALYTEQGNMVPTAVCTYKRAHRQWKVVLSSGASLTLVDKSDVWDIVEGVEDLSTTKEAKRISRGRMQCRK